MPSPFALVLHTHLPMVVNHGRWPHGSDWLNDAAFECYLPLLEVAHRLVADGISPKWTINISPVLAEQLASAEFQKELAFYYENVRRACVDSRAHFVREGHDDIVELTRFWEQFYERMWELHRRIGGDIPGHSPSSSAAATSRSSPARRRTATCRSSRAMNRSASSSAPRWRRTSGTSAPPLAASGCPSAPTGLVTSGRRPPARIAATGGF